MNLMTQNREPEEFLSFLEEGIEDGEEAYEKMLLHKIQVGESYFNMIARDAKGLFERGLRFSHYNVTPKMAKYLVLKLAEIIDSDPFLAYDALATGCTWLTVKAEHGRIVDVPLRISDAQ